MSTDQLDTPVMTPREVAAETARRIRAYPEHHDQQAWFVGDSLDLAKDVSEWDCGSTACCAGHVAFVAHPGATLDVSGTAEYGYRLNGSDGKSLGRVPDLAQNALDLTRVERYCLFDPTLGEGAVLRGLDNLANGRPLRDGIPQ